MPNLEQLSLGTIEAKNEQRAKEILADLDLKIEDLKGRKILDIGAGNAEIAKVLNNKGAKVFSLEINLESVKKEYQDFSAEGANYVQAKAEKTPFKDEVFDLLISHGSPPMTSPTKEEIAAVIKEGYRVLSKKGEWRIGKGYLNAAAFTDLNLPDNLPFKERVKIIKDNSLSYLKSIWSGQVEEIQKGENLDEIFYRLVK